MRSTPKSKYSVVDLFAGAGGLSYGFLQTGRFDVKAAFENNRNAQKTYQRNHGTAEVYNDVADALTVEIKEKIGQVDIVIGGPPCQGFSNANRQKNHAISQNNSLVKKFVQAVLHLNPTAFVMENVSMLKSEVHRFYVDENDREVIKKYNIKTTPAEIVLLDEAFMFDGVADIVADVDVLNNYLWDEKDYLVLNVIYKMRKNKGKLKESLIKHKKKLQTLSERILLEEDIDDYILRQANNAGQAIQQYFSATHTDEGADGLCESIEIIIMIQRMLSKAKEIYNNKIVVSEYAHERNLVAKVSSMSVVDYIESILGAPSSGYIMDKGVLSAAAFGAPQKRMRFVVIGIKKEKADKIDLPKGMLGEEDFQTVKDAIKDLEDIATTSDIATGNKGIQLSEEPKDISDLGRQLRDSKVLYNHVTTATTNKALERFRAIKQGDNFHSLEAELKTSYSDPTRTQNTIYLRLNYNEPSGTVVNVRKSMWIHPVNDRALSIREAARLQTFPDSFVFCGTKDSQYQQVGNAVPPILAKAIAEHLCKYLDGEN
ncbi:DNA cytosine methyltransferase [Enterocloster sp. OA13]|uniref:DNA cytosine methyltransferase n=1 Tax=Enterocloster sp. OA13 TaxID=2914161 RepID=UPI00046E6838|nr:DNA cytosine methyltransferase [Enterocloster sp. OA13]